MSLLEEKYLTTNIRSWKGEEFFMHMPDKFAVRGRKQPRTISNANVFYSDLGDRPWVSEDEAPPPPPHPQV